MKVLSIGTDRKIFGEGSPVELRQLSYASKTDEYHVIVFSLGNAFSYKKIGNLHIYPTNSISRFSYIFDAVKIGRKILANSSGFVISTQDPFETGFVGLKLSKEFKVPLQVQVHADFLSPYFKNSFLNRIRFLIANNVLPQANGIRVVSSFISHEIKQKYKNLKAEIDILPIFVDVQKIIDFEPKRDLAKEFPDFKFLILMASRLSSEKRIDIAIKVFKKVLDKFPHSGLLIAGEGKEKSKLKGIVRKLGIKKSVEFLGWQNDLISLYKTADLFLLTSEYEGYGLTLIEAGASGCPVVTTKVGVAKTDLFHNGENALICAKLDANCIAMDLIEIISNNAKGESMRHNLKERLREAAFSEEEYRDRYVSLLSKLIK